MPPDRPFNKLCHIFREPFDPWIVTLIATTAVPPSLLLRLHFVMTDIFHLLSQLAGLSYTAAKRHVNSGLVKGVSVFHNFVLFCLHF